MPATTAYQAGLETTNTQLSYAPESIWATLPTSTFQAARILSESLKHTKTRTRPPEIRGDRQAAPPTTTQESAAGSIVLPVYAASTSASPFEDFLSGVLGNDWGAPTTIVAAAGDIALNAAAKTITSTTAGKFTGIPIRATIKLKGFTNAGNNVFVSVLSNTGTVITYATQDATALVTETPAGAAAQITYSSIKNGTQFKSFSLQQRLDPAGTKWFRYLGSYLSRCQMTLQLGQFAQATFDVMAQQELKGLADASTGGIIAAPSTRVMDPVSGFKATLFNDMVLGSSVDQLSLDLSNDGAAGEYALGTALAQGMLQGTFMGSAKFRTYLKDLSLYDQYRSETPGVFSFRMGDQAGNQYQFTAPNTTLLLENGIPVDGPNKAMMAEFTAEFSPDPASGATVIVDRFAYNA